MENPNAPLLSKQQLRYAFAASVLAVAALVLVAVGLVSGGVGNAAIPSSIAFLFILPTIVLLYVDAREGQGASFRIGVLASSVFILGEIIADASGRVVLYNGGSIAVVAVPEATLLFATFAAYLIIRARARRPPSASDAGTG